jgi:hypothetical protein
MKAFLCFVVERVLAGDVRSLKAYTIGVEALGRRIDFNPATDAIVRVEAGRLRESLACYYEGEGATDPVIIDMPRGSYVPRFAWRKTGEASAPISTHQGLVFAAELQRLRGLLEETSRLSAAMKASVGEVRRTICRSQSAIKESNRLLNGIASAPAPPQPIAATHEIRPEQLPAPRLAFAERRTISSSLQHRSARKNSARPR